MATARSRKKVTPDRRPEFESPPDLPPVFTPTIVRETKSEIAEPINKTKIIRTYIDEVGVESANTRDLNQWLAKRYPGLHFTSAALRTTLSLQKKKLTKTTVNVLPSSEAAADLNDFLARLHKIKRMSIDVANELGIKNFDELNQYLDSFSKLSAEAGGFDNLVKSIRAIHDLMS